MKSKRKIKNTKRRGFEQIPDTPENVAKALFGVKLTGRKSNAKPKEELKR